MATIPSPQPKPGLESPLRLGPQPLALHLATTLCAWLSLPIMWPSLKNASPSLKPDIAARKQKLDALLAPVNPEFQQALAREAVARASRFLQGVRAYRRHDARRDVAEAPVVWHKGTTRLRDYNTQNPDAPAVLVIPSLINRFDILDLDLAPSFLRTLASHGFRPLVVDWDRPGHDEQNFGCGDYVAERLIPALAFIQAGKKARPVHVIGYCMGGLWHWRLAARKPDAVRTLSLLATPWDFHKPDPAIGAQFLEFAAGIEPELKTFNQLPSEVIQGLFAVLQPLQALTKFTDFAAADPGSMEARQFVLVEDWLNDGVPLTAKLARECLIDWYGHNVTGNMKWRLAGKLVDPRKIEMPTYVVVPGRDRIVPPDSALALAKLLPHATLHEPMTGHIGMMASRNASHQVWAPLLHWLEEHA